MSLNRFCCIGRLCADPELKQLPSGKPALGFAVAVQRDYKNATGERETDFIDCQAYGTTAEFIAKYFAKGSMIGIDGQIHTRTYEKDGQKRKFTECVITGVSFAGQSGKAPAASAAPDAEYPELDDEGDLPF